LCKGATRGWHGSHDRDPHFCCKLAYRDIYHVSTFLPPCIVPCSRLPLSPSLSLPIKVRTELPRCLLFSSHTPSLTRTARFFGSTRWAYSTALRDNKPPSGLSPNVRHSRIGISGSSTERGVQFQKQYPVSWGAPFKRMESLSLSFP
jgi:hypothetical protein